MGTKWVQSVSLTPDKTYLLLSHLHPTCVCVCTVVMLSV